MSRTTVAKALAYLDSRSAVYEPSPGFPGWFQARWLEPGEQCPERWACADEPHDNEREYARAFRARAEGRQAC